MFVSLRSTLTIAGYNMASAIRKKSGAGVKTNWRFIWSRSEIDKMITRTEPNDSYIVRMMNNLQIRHGGDG